MKLQREEESGRKRQVHDRLVAVLVTVSMQAGVHHDDKHPKAKTNIGLQLKALLRCRVAAFFYEKVTVFIQAPLNVTISSHMAPAATQMKPRERSQDKLRQPYTPPPSRIVVFYLHHPNCFPLETKKGL